MLVADLLIYEYFKLNRTKSMQKVTEKDIVFNLINFEQQPVVKLIVNYWNVEQSLNTTNILF